MRNISTDITITAANGDDLPQILALLEECELPTEGLATHLSTTLVARKGRKIVGCSGLEIYQQSALLRSVAVKRAFRRQGLATNLVKRMLALAKHHKVTSVYLLTTTASTFFSRIGFSIIQRSDVPEKIKHTAEFTSLCPDSATIMANLIND